jgi:hypothetical protein
VGIARIREQTGTGWNEHGLLFPRPDGSWWNPPAITLAFIRAVKRAGSPGSGSRRTENERHL